MHTTEFLIKADVALTAEDFAHSPLWAGYYEPDDVAEIVRWGVSEDRVRAALDAVDWQDDHYFPLPVEAANTHWMRGKLYAAQATTSGGKPLTGYIGERQDLVVIFVDGARYVLTANTPEEADRLANAIGEPTIFPLALTNRVTGEAWQLVPLTSD